MALIVFELPYKLFAFLCHKLPHSELVCTHFLLQCPVQLYSGTVHCWNVLWTDFCINGKLHLYCIFLHFMHAHGTWWSIPSSLAYASLSWRFYLAAASIAQELIRIWWCHKEAIISVFDLCYLLVKLSSVWFHIMPGILSEKLHL